MRTLAVLSGLTLVVSYALAWDSPVVSLPYATYRGLYNETSGLNEFLGIVGNSTYDQQLIYIRDMHSPLCANSDGESVLICGGPLTID